MNKKKKKFKRSLKQMIETRGLWYAMKYYNVIPLAASLIIILLFHSYLTDFICQYFELAKRGKELLYNVTIIGLPIGMLFLWFLAFFFLTRKKRYYYLTYGRDFGSDQAKYEKTFDEMTEFFHNCEPHKMYVDKYPIQNWRKCRAICFGYDPEGRAIFLPADCEYNICIFGPPGSSKTAGFCNVNAITFPGSCLVVDIKSDIYHYVSTHCKRKIARFCPDDPDAINTSWHFDPLAGVTEMSVTDRKLKIESMAASLIPDDGGTDGNYFAETARIYFQGIVHLMLHKDKNVSFPQIIHAILQGNFADWVYEAEQSDCTEAKELLLSLKGNSEKNVSGAYQNLNKRLNVYSNPVLDEILTYKQGKTLSINTLNKGIDVYLQISELHLDSYGPLLTMVISAFSNDFLKRPDTSTGAKNRHVLMMLDELSSLHLSYQLLNLNLSKLRSKSILTAIILQNLPQLQYLYKPEGAMSILGNCHVQAILGANDPTTARYFSDKLGFKKDYKVSNTITTVGKQKNTSKNVTTDDKVSVYRPEDVADLKSEGQNILYVDGKYTFLKKLNCYKE